MPNVALIVLNAARVDHLSCCGYHRPTTPNIDQLAAEGILYENVISPAIWTIPNTDTHKPIWSSNHEHELYDLESDPGEEHNVFLTNREEASYLRTLLGDWEVEHGIDQEFSIGADRQEEETAPVVERRLRDLGYI